MSAVGASPLRLVERASGREVVERLEIADAFWSRLVGLQFRRELHTGSGVLLVPCSSVHTCFVRFAIDVVLLDRHARVMAVRRHVRPWRVVARVAATHAVLELPAGTAQLAVGSRVRIEPIDIRIGHKLRFLC